MVLLLQSCWYKGGSNKVWDGTDPSWGFIVHMLSMSLQNFPLWNTMVYGAILKPWENSLLLPRQLTSQTDRPSSRSCIAVCGGMDMVSMGGLMALVPWRAPRAASPEVEEGDFGSWVGA